MKYTLNQHQDTKQSMFSTLRTMVSLLRGEKMQLLIALAAMLINSAATFVGPFLVGRTIDKYVIPGNFHGVLVWTGILAAVYLVAFVTNYIQMIAMGMVGQRTLFSLRNRVFQKLQSLPVAFFNQNKAGDLISRINNDTDKLNQFFSEIVVRSVGIFMSIIGVAAFLIGINWKLGVIALLPAIGMVFVIRAMAGWVKEKNVASLRATGTLSAEVQESLDNFKVVVAFDRRDFFRERFGIVNDATFRAAQGAGIANAVPAPLYDFANAIAQMIVLIVGIGMIASGAFTLGLLVSFFVYIDRFYGPLRQVSYLWTGLQTAVAAWGRISAILSLESDLESTITHDKVHDAVIEFEDVTFGYVDDQKVLDHISLSLAPGRTYALVGPTGGGKTTTASLMARLYDPVAGTVRLMGKDIRSYSEAERTSLVGFILQDPFLFSGTVQDNIFYANPHYGELSKDEALRVLHDAGFDTLLARFDAGLDTPVNPSGNTLSLGQRQIIAFMRAVLRRPRILILDEATANIDTVTEGILGNIIDALPVDTTRVVIAHRLNTIQNADEIFFVSGGSVTSAGDFHHAVEMLLQGGSHS
jgi:ATP-binding cassette subfamily B protein